MAVWRSRAPIGGRVTHAHQARPRGSSMSGCSSKPTLSGELTSLAAERTEPLNMAGTSASLPRAAFCGAGSNDVRMSCAERLAYRIGGSVQCYRRSCTSDWRTSTRCVLYGRMCPAAWKSSYHSGRVRGRSEPSAAPVTRSGLVVPRTTCIWAGWRVIQAVAMAIGGTP